MTVKIYFANQTHKLTQLPESLSALSAVITSLFKTELPASWVIQHEISKNNQVTISTEEEFKNLLSLESTRSIKAIKLHVLPSQEKVILPNVETKHKEVAKYPDFSDYEVISQNKGEKPAIAETKPPQQIIEAQEPQVTLKPLEKDSNDQLKKAIALVKFLAKGKYPETEKIQRENELSAIKENLTEEQLQKFEMKRAEIEERIAKRNARIQAKGEAPKKAERKMKDRKEKNSFDLKKFIRTFSKLVKSTRKEQKPEKIAHLREKLFAMIPENGKSDLESMLISFPKDLEKGTLQIRVIEESKKFIEENFVEGKEKVVEELEQISQKKREKRQRVQGDNGKKKKKVRDDKKLNEKKELVDKYSKVALKKAMKMKRIYANEEISTLCAYVHQKPEEASMEELVLNYRK